MEEQLKIGIYIRTLYGIAKIVDIDRNTCSVYVDRCLQPIDETRIPYEDIIGKPSFDIVDLIQEYDIISGRVDNSWRYINKEVVYFDRHEGKLFVGNDESDEIFVSDIHIDKILTKEQYETGAYKIEGEE